MVTLQVRRTHPGWGFWLLWIGASIAGVALATLILMPLFQVLLPRGPGPAPVWLGSFIMAGSMAGIGAGIGLGQWLVLRTYLKRLGLWVAATAVGYALPNAVGPRLGPILLLVYGVAIGGLQWLLLRGRVHGAGWWVLFSIASWALAFGFTGAAYMTGMYIEPMDMLFAFLVPVALGGAGMVWLLRRSTPELDLPVR